METDRLILALVQSQNEAADDVLLEGLRRGNDQEKPILLAALLKRATVRGLRGVIGQYDTLPESLQREVISNVRQLHEALRECGRSDDDQLRLAAMKLIALGRQGKLAYVLSENLRSQNDDLSKGAINALVALSRWVSMQTKWLQKGEFGEISAGPVGSGGGDSDEAAPLVGADALTVYNELWAQRGEIETAVARAIDLSRGRYGPELLRAALLLCDWPGSKTLGILQTAKHGGQTAMVRRLEQPPDSEHVAAFLLAASHGQLRSQFGTVFAHITEVPVLDALLRKTHWLKDSQLQLCMHQVMRGAWWGESELLEDITRRDADQAARIGDWLVASGAHDVVQDDRMDRLRGRAEMQFAARLRLLRLASHRRRGSSVQLIKAFLNDPDERIARMATRELLRRRPPEYENLLLTRMPKAAESVRRVIGRSLGHIGFEQFWQRFDQLDRPTRQSAGRAMLKILPDAIVRLTRRLNNGPLDQRLKAMQMAQDLALVNNLREVLKALAAHANPKVRSKAISVLGSASDGSDDALLKKVLQDGDARVRANAVEVIELTVRTSFIPILVEKARNGSSRERANSIKAMHKMRLGQAGDALAVMLKDERADHRISALWALRQMSFWKLLSEVGRLAKEDANMRVRRYALGILKGVAEMLRREKAKAG